MHLMNFLHLFLNLFSFRNILIFFYVYRDLICVIYKLFSINASYFQLSHSTCVISWNYNPAKIFLIIFLIFPNLFESKNTREGALYISVFDKNVK